MVYIGKGKNKYNSNQLTLLKIKIYTVYTTHYSVCIYTQWSEKFWSNLIQTINVHELYK